jgi:hypothetical protein
MDSDIVPALVRDSRLEDIKSSLIAPLYSGSQSSVYQIYNSNVPTNTSSISWSFNPPSENVAIDRRFIIEADIKVRITRGDTNLEPPGSSGFGGDLPFFDYGSIDAFQSFPFARLQSTTSVRLNEVVFNQNVQEILPCLLRMMDEEDYAYYNPGCPTYPDNLKQFDPYSGIDAQNDPLNGYDYASYKQFAYPRASYPIFDVTAVDQNGAAIPLKSVAAVSNGSKKIITLTIRVREPIFCSPLVFSHSNNQGAFIGIRNVHINMNLDTTAKRCFSCNPNNTQNDIQLISVTNAKLHVNYLSIPSTLQLPNKVVFPFTQYVLDATTKGGPIPTVSDGDLESFKNYPNLGVQTITMNSISLQGIPDKIVFYVCKSIENQTIEDTDSFYPIHNISINFNNRSGILSTADQFMLYRLSRDNGLNQEWGVWSGLVTRSLPANAIPVGSTGCGGIGQNLVTAGGPLILNPSRDLGLEEGLTNGMNGSYNLSATVQYKVLGTGNDIGANDSLKLYCLTIYSGYVRLENGQSQTIINPFTAETVLNMLSSQSLSYDQQRDGERLFNQLVGGSASSDLYKKMKKSPFVNDSLGGARSAGKKKMDLLCM